VIRAALAALLIGAAMAASKPAPRRHEIRIAQFEFTPRELVVAPGDTVVWRNADLFPHTTTADSAKWRSLELATDSAFVIVASDTGRFGYHCSAHPSMKGVLTVRY
jgi:plastocyanin